MKQLATGIYVETGLRRVTLGAILTDEGWILIDTPPYPEDARSWRKVLTELADLPFLYVVNTDHHRDRVLGHQWFDAPLVMHRAAARRSLEREASFLNSAAVELATDDQERLEIVSLKPVLPHVSYSDEMTIKRGGRDVTLMHVPGPTAGSTWVEFPEEQIVFVGDHVVTTTHPFMAEAVSKAWLDALTWLRRDRWKGYKIVPGRGSVTKADTSRQVSDYVRLARRRVQTLLRAGRPRGDTAELVGSLISEYPARDGDREEVERRIRAGLERIYDEMKAGDDE